MGNIISLLQEIFMLKENNSTRVGLSDFRDIATPVEKVSKKSTKAPKVLFKFRTSNLSFDKLDKLKQE